MVSAWLFDNTPTSLWTQNVFASQDREYGNNVTPLAAGRVAALRWYRVTAGTTQKPTILRIWDIATASVIATAGSIPDNNATGWQVHTLATPPAITQGQRLRVSFAWQTNRQYTSGGLGSVPSPSYPAALSLFEGWNTNAAAIGFPTNVVSGEVFGCDALIQAQAPPAMYTSAGATTYNDSLKWAVAANRYRLTITTPVQWASAQLVQGEDVRRVVGFWQPYLADGLGPRYPIDALNVTLQMPDRSLMQGLLLDTFPGSAGTVEAFTVDDA